MKINEVIEEIKKCRLGKNRAWIYNENGEIADNVLCCDIIPLLENLIPYEIEMTDNEIINMLECVSEKYNGYNTYNYSCNISNDINYYVDKDNNLCIMRIHLIGDIRCNYTDWFVIDMENFDNFIDFIYNCGDFALDDAIRKSVYINDRYVADVAMFSEEYNVYDYIDGVDIGYFYEVEVDDLLARINEEIKEDN